MKKPYAAPSMEEIKLTALETITSGSGLGGSSSLGGRG